MNKKRFSGFRHLPALLIISAIWGCAGGGMNGNRNFMIPAGIDSTIARQADSLAYTLFVTPKNEHKAEKLKEQGRIQIQSSDSLWALIEHNTTANIIDSAASIEAFNEGARLIERYARMNQNAQKSVENRELFKQVEDFLDVAVENFEKALVLNPFDLDARSWLAHVYKLKADRFEREKAYKNAAGVLEDLIRLDKGNHAIYARLAENYYAMGSWKAAFDVFGEAENILVETAFLNVDEAGAPRTVLSQAAIDTTILFNYVFYQGIAQAKLYDADSSLSILHRALDLVSDAESKASVQSYIDWINWDDGNIRGSEMRDNLLILQAEHKYKEATAGLWELSKKLRTARARDEIEWRASVLDYQKLGLKAKGVQGLHNLIKRWQVRNPNGKADSTYQRYFENYAIMCHNLGLEHVNMKNWQEAYAYFLQATQVQWRGRPKSHLEIAKIVQNDPNLVIKHCKQAQDEKDTLNLREQKQLYKLLSMAYLKIGDAELSREARYEWLQLKDRKEVPNAPQKS